MVVVIYNCMIINYQTINYHDNQLFTKVQRFLNKYHKIKITIH